MTEEQCYEVLEWPKEGHLLVLPVGGNDRDDLIVVKCLYCGFKGWTVPECFETTCVCCEKETNYPVLTC